MSSKLGALSSSVLGDTLVHPPCRLIIFLNLSIAGFTYWPQFSGQEIEAQLSLGSSSTQEPGVSKSSLPVSLPPIAHSWGRAWVIAFGVKNHRVTKNKNGFWFNYLIDFVHVGGGLFAPPQAGFVGRAHLLPFCIILCSSLLIAEFLKKDHAFCKSPKERVHDL